MGKPFIDRTGEKHITNQGYSVKIIKYKNSKNCVIIFEENINNYKKCTYKNIVSGEIKNPYHKSVYNTGYLGIGRYSVSIKGKGTKTYQTWKGMMERGYSNKFKENNPTYKDCSVDEHWHNFQNFAEWFEDNYKENFHLDKDALIKDNKIYSSKTCCFIPNDINSLFVRAKSARGVLPIGVLYSLNNKKYTASINLNSTLTHLGTFNTPEETFQAYKVAKERYIKEKANKWKDKISDKTYQALINYKVEITD